MASPAPVGLRIVLLLNNPFVADSRSWKLARSLSDVGCDVTVVARRADGLPDREVREGFRIVRLDQPRPLGWLPMPALPEGAVTDERRPRIGRAGRVAGGVIDALGRVAQAGRYLLLARQWAGRIAQVVPGADVWQAEGLITLPVALQLRRRLEGRAVYDARDLSVESARFARLPGPWRRLLANRERAWARAADATITANQPYADVLERWFRIRPAVVFNGPLVPARERSGGRMDLRAQLQLAPEARVVLYLGNVAPDRGVEQLCRAIAEIPDAVLVVVGPGGPFRERLREEARGLPAADRIHFLPAVAPEQIPAITASADVAAMPIQPSSLNHRLTTPTRLFDALGAGVPVVASDLPGMAQIIRATGAGVLCDPTNARSIAAAIREVLDAPEDRRAALRAAALAAARGPYAWERQMDVLFGVYRDLGLPLGRADPAPRSPAQPGP